MAKGKHQASIYQLVSSSPGRSRRRRRPWLLVGTVTVAGLTLSAAVAGCRGSGKTTQRTATTSTPAVTTTTTSTAKPVVKEEVYDRVPRAELNQLAAELALPLFWAADDNQNKALDPAELAVLWGIDPQVNRARYVKSGAFTADFKAAYQRIEAQHMKKQADKPPGQDDQEAKRRSLVRQELAQGRPTLVRSSFEKASPEDRAIVQNIMAAAGIIETIFEKQMGSYELRSQIPADDPASRMLFYRNHGPWCLAPKTEQDKDCNAVPSLPEKLSGLYPAELQKEKDFCAKLAKHKDGKKLQHQFFVVRQAGEELTAVPYHEAYAEELKAVSDKLKAAAAAITGDAEQAFKAYLLAAAQAFTDNSWEAADEAWAKMSAQNSKWYLRIGPDEVYFEPCNFKAGFHVSFARINPDSVRWQQKLDPVKNEMEQEIASLAGEPYKAREIAFHLPDFIDIVLNAGDSRSFQGATIGQSLPNWGPVADESRGRTVVMTNLYTDPDSLGRLEEQAKSLLCAESMAKFTPQSEPAILSVVLHEAAHNLGPSHSYKVAGMIDRDIFGGPLASTIEELKAQTAALYFVDWLRDKQIISAELGDQAHVRDLIWAFGHIAQGMYTAEKKPKPYSQLAAIQLGYLVKEGAAEWQAEQPAANQQDKGCLALHLDKLAPAIKKLMAEVAGIKARGDKAKAQQLKKDYVDVEGDKQALLDVIRERWLRGAKASFVYAVEL